MNITLPDQMKNSVEENVRTGCYWNPSDYVREYNMCLEQLHFALIEGENSGIAKEFDMDTFIASKKKSLKL